MKNLLALLLLCALLTGCSYFSNIEGTWVTSDENTLCGTVLVIEGSRFTLTQEGRTTTGQWFHDVGNIMLYEDVEHPAQSGSVKMALYDKSDDTLVLGELTLRRE